MAEYSDLTTGNREYTNPGRDPGGPRTPSDPSTYDFVLHPGSVGHYGNSVNGVGNNSGLEISKGDYVYAKAGNTVFFFDDNQGKKQVGPAGGKGGQTNAPSRSGINGIFEYVGTFNGNATKEFLQVDWLNYWYQDGPLGTKGDRKTENKTSWVRISSVDVSKTYIPNGTLPAPPAPTFDPTPQATGIDSTTLGIMAVGAAFLLKKKKRK